MSVALESILDLQLAVGTPNLDPFRPHLQPKGHSQQYVTMNFEIRVHDA